MEKQSDTTGITKSYMEKILEQRQKRFRGLTL